MWSSRAAARCCGCGRLDEPALAAGLATATGDQAIFSLSRHLLRSRRRLPTPARLMEDRPNLSARLRSLSAPSACGPGWSPQRGAGKSLTGIVPTILTMFGLRLAYACGFSGPARWQRFTR